MNDRPAISVIVAVYKAESYLQKCLDSLRAQTFQDFEVLLVDDGSPDHSGAICDEYAATDSRFRVFHKENGGVSSARQCGIDHARGEYTIHADPDDWVEPDMLAQLYAKAKAEDADMVICDYYVDARGNSRRIVQRPSALDHETVLRELFQQLHGSCWNKLVKRACYSEYRVAFPLELSFCEDLYVNAAFLCHDLRIAYLPQAFYHYVQDSNPSSLTYSNNHKILLQKIELHRLLKEILPNNDYNTVYPYLQASEIWSFILCKDKYSAKQYHTLKRSLKKLHIPYKRKLIIFVALYFSLGIARMLYRISKIIK